MTDNKLVIEPLEDLENKARLPDKAIEFLEWKHKSKFMTKFIVGSNKLEFYGHMFELSKRSDLLKSKLEMPAEQYILLEFAEVDEQSFTIVWLILNAIFTDITEVVGKIPVDKTFQVFSIMEYMGVDKQNFYYKLMTGCVCYYVSHESKDKKAAMIVEQNKDIVVKVLRQLYNHTLEATAYIPRVLHEYRELHPSVYEVLIKEFIPLVDIFDGTEIDIIARNNISEDLSKVGCYTRSDNGDYVDQHDWAGKKVRLRVKPEAIYMQRLN